MLNDEQKKKLTQWNKNGGTAAAVKSEKPSAQLGRPPKEVKPFVVYNSETIASRPVNKNRYLCRKLGMTMGGVSLLCAEPKVGKSSLLRELTHAVASDDDLFLGSKVAHGGVFYLDLETSEELILDHLRLLNGGIRSRDPEYPDEPNAFIVTGAEIHPRIQMGFLQQTENSIARLRQAIKDNPECVLFILDTMVKFFSAMEDTNDYVAECKILSEIKLIAAENPHIHICITHHANKNRRLGVLGNVNGAHSIAGCVDVIILLQKDGEYDAAKRYIASEGRDSTTDIPRSQLFYDHATGHLSLGERSKELERVERVSTTERVVNDITEFLTAHPGSERKTIRDNVKAKDATFRDVFTSMARGRAFTTRGDGKKNSPFLYVLAPIASVDITAPPACSSDENLPPLVEIPDQTGLSEFVQ